MNDNKPSLPVQAQPVSGAETMRAALERIARWHGEFPSTGKTWKCGEPMTYGEAYGSNGERDYMRQVARAALAATQSAAAPAAPVAEQIAGVISKLIGTGVMSWRDYSSDPEESAFSSDEHEMAELVAAVNKALATVPAQGEREAFEAWAASMCGQSLEFDEWRMLAFTAGAQFARAALAAKVQPVAVPDVQTLVNRFLSWPMPDSLSARIAPNVTKPIGTHLMNADEAKAMVTHCMEGLMRPTDDHLWDATLRDRDNNAEWADKLANAIAEHFGADIGEHSNMNCPWAEALDLIESAAAHAPAQQDKQAGDVARDAGALEIACIINRKLGEALAGRAYLLPDDLAALKRFHECATDFDSGGHDVPKAVMARLREIGVMQSIGFGRHQTTAFGDYVLERADGEPVKLPLVTLVERNAAKVPQQPDGAGGA